MYDLGQLIVGALVTGFVEKGIDAIDLGKCYEKSKDLAKQIDVGKLAKQYYENRLQHNMEEVILQAHRRLEEYKSDGQEIVLPPESIVVPVCNLSAVYGSDQRLRSMFAELLAKSALKDKQKFVLVRYAKFIEQLSPDEALILDYMKKHNIRCFPTIDIMARNDVDGKFEILRSRVTDSFDTLELQNHQNLQVYFDDLIGLGIFESVTDRTIGDEHMYDRIINTDEVQGLIKETKKRSDGYNVEQIKKGCIGITNLGIAFMDVCISDDWDSGNVYRL